MTERMSHLLIIDDDQRIRSLLKKFLCKAGFRVTSANGSYQARQLLKSLKFDMLVCDVMMPGEDGLALTNSISDILSVPIILLTAKGDTLDRIAGLKAGADDYIAKPFEPQELLLRIQAILRRVYKLDRGELWCGADLVRLTTTEAILMQIFSKKPNITFSRPQLVFELGRDKGQAQERAIDVQITRLRKKIEVDPKTPRYLQTVRSAGYIFTPD